MNQKQYEEEVKYGDRLPTDYGTEVRDPENEPDEEETQEKLDEIKNDSIPW